MKYMENEDIGKRKSENEDLLTKIIDLLWNMKYIREGS